jgi:hypothetical protein
MEGDSDYGIDIQRAVETAYEFANIEGLMAGSYAPYLAATNLQSVPTSGLAGITGLGTDKLCMKNLEEIDEIYIENELETSEVAYKAFEQKAEPLTKVADFARDRISHLPKWEKITERLE